jgi:hypothetical protein
VRAVVAARDLAGLDDGALVRACLRPAIAAIRGQPLARKSLVFDQLGPGQRALLAWYTFHAHAEDPDGFWTHATLLVTGWRTWSHVEDSARFFAHDELGLVYRAIADAVAAGAGASDRLGLFAAYHAAAAGMVQRGADHIRQQPEEFVRLLP